MVVDTFWLVDDGGWWWVLVDIFRLVVVDGGIV